MLLQKWGKVTSQIWKSTDMKSMWKQVKLLHVEKTWQIFTFLCMQVFSRAEKAIQWSWTVIHKSLQIGILLQMQGRRPTSLDDDIGRADRQMHQGRQRRRSASMRRPESVSPTKFMPRVPDHFSGTYINITLLNSCQSWYSGPLACRGGANGALVPGIQGSGASKEGNYKN